MGPVRLVKKKRGKRIKNKILKVIKKEMGLGR